MIGLVNVSILFKIGNNFRDSEVTIAKLNSLPNHLRLSCQNESFAGHTVIYSVKHACTDFTQNHLRFLILSSVL